jgi:DNA repair photolyase
LTAINAVGIPARRALGRGALPDNFTRSLYKLSPYQGCAHGCRYCDGRAERYYVAGDFERDIVIRSWIPDLLAAELPRLREPGMVAIDREHDPNQKPKGNKNRRPLRRSLADPNLPVTVMTKSDLVLRDLPTWERVNSGSLFVLLVSLTTLDESVRAVFEPGASPVKARLSVLRAFKKCGCAVGVLAMPFLPGVSDEEESICALYEELGGIGWISSCRRIDLTTGRQKDLYMKPCSCHPTSWVHYRLYQEDRPSG